MSSQNGYGELPPELQQVHWRVDSVEKDLEKECQERKENDKIIFSKIDSIKDMAIYQLCAIILVLIGIIAIYLKDAPKT